MALLAINKNPTPGALRLFAGLWFPLFFAFIGLKAWKATGSLVVAGFVWGAATLIAVACLTFLPLARLLYSGLMAITFPIGYVLSHVILGVVFYGVLTPIGLVLRALGTDPMQRKIDRTTESYWIARAGHVPMEQYFRQY